MWKWYDNKKISDDGYILDIHIFPHVMHNGVFQPSGICQKGCGELLRRSENCQLSEMIKQKSISHLYWIGLTFIKEMKINVAWHTVTQ